MQLNVVEGGWRTSNKHTKWTKVIDQGAAPGKAPPMLKLNEEWISVESRMTYREYGKSLLH